MFLVIWEFIVKEGREAEFEQLYGPRGDWNELFGRAEGFLGTQLYCDEKTLRRYITLDRWTSSGAFERFKQEHRSAYEALDARGGLLTGTERLLGAFQERS